MHGQNCVAAVAPLRKAARQEQVPFFRSSQRLMQGPSAHHMHPKGFVFAYFDLLIYTWTPKAKSDRVEE